MASNPGNPNMQDDIRDLRSVLGQLQSVTFKDFANDVEFIAEGWKQAGIEVGNVVDLAKELQNEQRDLAAIAKQLAKDEGNVTGELKKAAAYEKDILKLKQGIANQQSIVADLQQHGVHLTQDEADAMADMAKEVQNIINLLQQKAKLAKKEEERLAREQKKVDNLIKGYGKFLGLFSKIPIIGGFLGSLINSDKVMGAMNEKAKKLGDKAHTTAGKFKILGEGLKQTFMNITNPMTIGSALIGGLFTLLYKVFMMAINLNKKFFEMAKVLGVSVGEATKLYSKFQAMAPLGMRAKEVAEAYAAASDSLGFMASTGSDFAITMAGLQKNIGASAEHMTALATQSALSGRSINNTFISMVGSAKAAGAQNKLALSTRQILDKVAKVSSTVLLNFKGNVNALAASVVRATKLGVTLDQINKQGESLLDFETSIASQFEAEAISGKQFNLERARTLALEGKTADLMEELNREGLTMSEWNSQNVIAKEAYAKMLGLSTEELSKQYILQQQAEKLGVKEGQSAAQRYEQLRKQGKTHEQIVGMIGAQEAASLRQQSLADKWQALLEKIQDTLGRIVMGPVTEIVNKMIAFLNNTEAIHKVGNFLKKIFQGISDVLSNLPTILKNAVQVSKVLASLAVARAVASIVSAAGMGGPAALVAGLGVGWMAYKELSKLVDNAMSGITGGGGGGLPAVTGASTSGNIEPLNTNTRTTAYGPNTDGKGGGKMVIENNLYVDGAPMARVANSHTSTDPATNFDANTSKGSNNVRRV